MTTVNIKQCVTSVTTWDGFTTTVSGFADDEFVTFDAAKPDPLPPFAHLPTMVLTLHAGSPSLNVLLVEGRRMPVPIDITIPTRPPKHRRHARGGLRKMIAPHQWHYTAHDMSLRGDISGEPWTCTMHVTRHRGQP